MELTLLGFGEKTFYMELLEDFSDILLVRGCVSGVDEDAIQLYYYANI